MRRSSTRDRHREERPIEGLLEPVEVVTDRWGVRHIYARNTHDLFFAQGYMAACDRLFQVEMWRRQATGTLSEVLGPREITRDRAARLFRFRGDPAREMKHYHPQGERIIGAFVEGVNRRIAQVREKPELLPVEFEALGFAPEPWTAEVVLTRHSALAGNAAQELQYGRLVTLLGAAPARDLLDLGPGEPRLEPDPSLDRSLLFENLLELLEAYRTPIAFQSEDVLPPYRDTAVPPPTDTAAGGEAGSNNWVVSGRLSESGRPVLANDPHRALQVPSLRYAVHLSAPGWDVIGAGEPALPGVAIGHNRHGAWGFTVFGIDTEDLYIYETHPERPRSYRYRGRWKPMRAVQEMIRVKGEEPVPVDLLYTRHGPVIYHDPARRRACALRAAWLEKGGAPYLATLRINQARGWEEFRRASRYHHMPAENFVWADVQGNIGWQAAGIAPVRDRWDGLVPVSGDGRYEWKGFLPGEHLPHVLNPPRGFWATANHMLIPEGYEHRNALGWEWAPPYRAERIAEVLGSGRHGVDDSIRLQQDRISFPAKRLVLLLQNLSGEQEEERAAIEALLGWDFSLDPGSDGAALFVSWLRRLQAHVRDLIVPEAARPYLPAVSTRKMIEWLTAPDARFGEDPAAGRDALLLVALREGVSDLQERLGPGREAWHYGQERFKHIRLRHPLGEAASAAMPLFRDIGPLPRGGNEHTVQYSGETDNQAAGASFALAVEVGNWESARWINTPGQSGDPSSPHYADLFDLWASGQYVPLPYRRSRVRAEAESTLLLSPSPG